MAPREFNTYFPDNETAIIVPRDKDRATVTRTEKSAGGKPATTTSPVARSVGEEMQVLAPYQPNEKELELVKWARETLEPVAAAEVHGIVYRSIKGFHIASPKDEIRVRAMANELGVGLPEYRS